MELVDIAGVVEELAIFFQAVALLPTVRDMVFSGADMWDRVIAADRDTDVADIELLDIAEAAETDTCELLDIAEAAEADTGGADLELLDIAAEADTREAAWEADMRDADTLVIPDADTERGPCEP